MPQTPSGLEKPVVGSLLWGTAVNAGFDAHDAWAGHRAIAAGPWARVVDPVAGNDSNPGFEDKPLLTLAAALSSVGTRGAPIIIKTAGDSETPHMTLSSSLTIDAKYCSIIGGGTQPGAGGPPPTNTPKAACLITGNVSTGGLFLIGARQAYFEGIALRNTSTNTNAHGWEWLASADQTTLQDCGAAACGGDGALLRNQVGQVVFRNFVAVDNQHNVRFTNEGVTLAPQRVRMINGRVERPRVANIKISDDTPGQGSGAPYMFDGVSFSGRFRHIWVEGSVSTEIARCYFEWGREIGDPGEVDESMIIIRGFRGGAAGTRQFWSQSQIIGPNNRFLGSAESDPPTWTQWRAKCIDIESCTDARIWGNQYRTGVSSAAASVNNPLIALGVNTQNCRVDIDEVTNAQRTARLDPATEAGKFYKNRGTGNIVTIPPA